MRTAQLALSVSERVSAMDGANHRTAKRFDSRDVLRRSEPKIEARCTMWWPATLPHSID